MKTAISLPEDTFAAATRRAHDLGVSRSQFFATAARRYLDELDADSMTAQIDQALAAGAGDESTTTAADRGRARLAAADW